LRRAVRADLAQAPDIGAKLRELVGIERNCETILARVDPNDRVAIRQREISVDDRVQESERIDADRESARQHEHRQQREPRALREEPHGVAQIGDVDHPLSIYAKSA
jgi:hypothetical protein